LQELPAPLPLPGRIPSIAIFQGPFALTAG